MTDKTFIANMALGHIRAGSISSFEDVSINGNNVRTFYDIARQATLESYDWSFARKRKSLALLVENAPDMWANRYEYPTNCIRARYIATPGVRRPINPIPFDVELDDAGTSRTILTDQEKAILVYTMDVDNPTLFSIGFVDALSWRLASYLAVPCAGRADDEKRCFQWWTMLTSVAETNDANEGQADKEPDGEFITARN